MRRLWRRREARKANIEAGFPPEVLDATLVGTYPALAKSGGGFVWDAVLEYRVWIHPERGGADLGDGSDYFYAFDSHADALEFARSHAGAEEPLGQTSARLEQPVRVVEDEEAGPAR